MTEVDAIVIGAGPGGYHAAIRLGQLGKNVVCFDRDEVGGVCLNWGCIPTKALLHVGEVARHIREAGKIGLKVAAPEVDREGVAKFTESVVKANVGGVNQLFKANNVTFAYGEASFAGPKEVALKKRRAARPSTSRRGRATARRSSTRTMPCSSNGSRRRCSSSAAASSGSSSQPSTRAWARRCSWSR
jgi:dihydrolipoamide dehydrogenase